VRDHSRGVQQLTPEELHPHDSSRWIHGEIFLQQKQIVGKPEVRSIAEKTLEFGGGTYEIHAGSTPALFRFDGRGPAVSPARKRGIRIVETHAPRMRNPQTMHERGLCAHLLSSSEKARVPFNTRAPPSSIKAQQREGEGHGPRIAAHVSTGGGLG
jgi:hypothetical protein